MWSPTSINRLLPIWRQFNPQVTPKIIICWSAYYKSSPSVPWQIWERLAKDREIFPKSFSILRKTHLSWWILNSGIWQPNLNLNGLLTSGAYTWSLLECTFTLLNYSLLAPAGPACEFFLYQSITFSQVEDSVHREASLDWISQEQQ